MSNGIKDKVIRLIGTVHVLLERVSLSLRELQIADDRSVQETHGPPEPLQTLTNNSPEKELLQHLALAKRYISIPAIVALR